MPYKQREQLSNLMLGKELTYEQREQISNFMRENNITYEQREDYIDFDVYLEIENVQYGRMLTELFENLTEGCLEQIVYLKREEDESARLIGRYTEVGDKLTKEEVKILNANGFITSGCSVPKMGTARITNVGVPKMGTARITNVFPSQRQVNKITQEENITRSLMNLVFILLYCLQN